MSRILRLSLQCLAALGALGLLAVAGAGAVYLWLSPGLPPVEAVRNVELQVPLRVHSADGALIAEFGEMRRTPVSLDAVPDPLVNAFIAAEDQRFYQHPGVDYQGLARAIWYLVRTGEKGPGGSTITMQLARNLFLSSERTYIRKAREILLALRIERQLDKREILELYLNKIYLGQRAYGVAAAAEVYYGRPLAELSLAEQAMIAGLPKAPSAWNPISNPERALERRAYVLGRMLDQGFIEQSAYQQAMAAPITAERHARQPELAAPFVAEMVRAQMVARYGEEEAYTRGFKVTTTLQAVRQAAANAALRSALHAYDERHGYRGPLDRLAEDVPLEPQALQEALEDYPRVGELHNAVVMAVDEDGAELISRDRDAPWRLPWSAMQWARPMLSRNALGPEPERPADVLAVRDVVRVRQTAEGPRLAQAPEAEGALVAVDPRDGRLVSLVGGYDFGRSKFNRAVQARRQPGSAFKPLIYSAALENGFTPATLVNDAPVVFEDSALESVWRPENYSGRVFGPTRLREALTYSRNLVSIRVLRSIGVEAAIDHIRRFGIDTAQLPRNLSLALGSAEVTPLELARSYAVFANGGHLVEPYFIQRIEGDEGEVLFAARPYAACDAGEAACSERADEAADGGPAVGDGEEPLQAAGLEQDLLVAVEEEDGAVPPARPAPQVIPPANAWLMRSMMRDVVQRGTARAAAALGRTDIAGKTGTTNDQRDAWFSGFNSHLVATAWVGFDELQSLGRYETGGRAALPMWMDYMRVALDGLPEADPARPDGLVTVRIDPDTGRLTNADNEDAIFETFREGRLPEAERQARGGSGGSDEGDDSASEQALF
ncbi:penicillin-binding protein 1A [Spiribacter halobius]|uniref:Penicillin-binding protein 1A n=1 Tax=Sediminicurvatus halobius TaxID=2182432 RepID=A0A2U2N6V7_9GAMM|nr:penicillin-binding protein 1A [Spiribacter halobius]PWG64812.1 peptidase [Spiribacter halobius]UEX78334.1 penicillin-binding protein 1A [Spiribacter halobius]